MGNVFYTLGLTQNEQKVYFALVEIGNSTSGAIIKKSGLYGTRVYESLGKLIEKGLVSYSFSKNIKHFQAAPPKKLLEIYTEQKSLLQGVVQSLEQKRPRNVIEQRVKIYEGLRGIKGVFNDILGQMKKGDELLVFGNPRVANDKLELFFLNFHQERIKKGTIMKALHNKNNRKYAQLREKWKFTEIRYMPKNVITPSWINIYKNTIFLFNMEDEPFVVQINNKKTAESYKEYFKLLWEQSKEK